MESSSINKITEGCPIAVFDCQRVHPRSAVSFVLHPSACDSSVPSVPMNPTSSNIMIFHDPSVGLVLDCESNIIIHHPTTLPKGIPKGSQRDPKLLHEVMKHRELRGLTAAGRKARCGRLGSCDIPLKHHQRSRLQTHQHAVSYMMELYGIMLV